MDGGTKNMVPGGRVDPEPELELDPVGLHDGPRPVDFVTSFLDIFCQ